MKCSEDDEFGRLKLNFSRINIFVIVQITKKVLRLMPKSTEISLENAKSCDEKTIIYVG